MEGTEQESDKDSPPSVPERGNNDDGIIEMRVNDGDAKPEVNDKLQENTCEDQESKGIGSWFDKRSPE